MGSNSLAAWDGRARAAADWLRWADRGDATVLSTAWIASGPCRSSRSGPLPLATRSLAADVSLDRPPGRTAMAVASPGRTSIGSIGCADAELEGHGDRGARRPVW